MILLKADSVVKAVFKKTIKVMEEDIEWNEIFVINNNTMILPGEKKSLVFNFDNRKVMKTVADINVDEDKARLMLDNQALENILNMLLYIFGKWGQIKGLTVQKNYEQLNHLINNVLYDVKAEVQISPNMCHFYKKSVQITYEDVVDLIIKEMLPFDQDEEDHDFDTSDDKEEKSDEEFEDDSHGKDDESQENKEDFKRDDDDEFYMGIWHKIVWKSKDIKFEKTIITQEDKKKRIGKDFYVSDYACPVCGKPIYMVVFPADDEMKIETDEKRQVLLARAYTCYDCHCLYTPRPNKMLLDSKVYELDFDLDKPAYDDYLELLGKKGRRVSNCNFNKYADLKKSDINSSSNAENASGQIEDENESDALLEWFFDNGYGNKMTSNEFVRLDKACKNIEKVPVNVLNEINEKIDSRFYSDNIANRYKTKVKYEVAKRNKKSTDSNNENANYSVLDDIANDKESNFKENDRTHVLSINDNLGSDDKIDSKTHDKTDDKTDSKTHERTDGEAIRNDTLNKNDETSSYDEKNIKQTQQKLLAMASSAKDKNFRQMKVILKRIESENCPYEVKQPIVDSFKGWMNTKGSEEIKELSDKIPEVITMKQYASFKEKLDDYDGVDKSQILDKLESKRDVAETNEVNTFIHRLNTKPINRRVLKKAMDDLKQKGFKEENIKPAIDKINEKLYDIDEKRISEICPDLMKMTFDEAAEVYEKIAKEELLPELKIDMLARIDKRLTNMKKDENKHLIRKFKKDTEYEPDKIKGIYLYNEEDGTVKNAIDTYGDSMGKYEYPIMICDYSKAGNGSKGFILTADHIFYKQMTNEGILNIRDVKEVSLENTLLNKGIYANYKKVGKIKISGQIKPGNGSKDDIDTFIDKLNVFIKYLKEKPESRKLSYMIHEKHAIKCCYRCGFVYKSGDICPKCGSKNNE